MISVPATMVSRMPAKNKGRHPTAAGYSPRFSDVAITVASAIMAEV
jgi:hypothetical protein